MLALRSSLAFIFILLLPVLGFAQETSIHRSLRAAIAAGEVHVDFASNGTSSGDSIIVTVSKTETAPKALLILTLQPGLRLTNSSKASQSMVIAGIRGRLVSQNSLTPESSIRLESTEPVKYVLAAYCAEFSKANPATDSKFSLEGLVSSLACVLQNSTKQGLSVHATQAAVWIQTDHVDMQATSKKFEVTSADWTHASEIVASCKSADLHAKEKSPPSSAASSALYTKESPSPSPLNRQASSGSSGKSGHVMTNSDVVNMAKNGLSESTIVLAIQNSPTSFDVSPDTLINLRKQHVPSSVLDAMIRKQSDHIQVSSVGNRDSVTNETLSVGGLAGVQVAELSEAIRRGAPNAIGVYVVKMEEAAPAKSTGLTAGDIIQSVILADDPNAPSPRNSSDFNKLAARCVPDCLVAVSRVALNYSSVRYLGVGPVGTNFVPEFDSTGKVRAYRNAKATGFPLSSPYPADAALHPILLQPPSYAMGASAGATNPPAMAYGTSPGRATSPYGMPTLPYGMAMSPNGMAMAPSTSRPNSPTPISRPVIDAPQVHMTPEEIDAAIAKGTQEKGQLQGIHLVDVGSQVMQGVMLGLIAAGAKTNGPTQIPASGFAVWMLTPRDWIAQQASLAVSEGRNFTSRDVTPEMLNATLHILAFPSTPPPTGSYTSAARSLSLDVSPVSDVYLTDEPKVQHLEPLGRETFNYHALTGQAVQFLLSDVSKIREQHAEFYVVITGNGANRKEFKVKAKHGFEMQ